MLTKEDWKEVQNILVAFYYKLTVVLVCISIISLVLSISNVNINVNILISSWLGWLVIGIIITVIDYIVIKNINGNSAYRK